MADHNGLAVSTVDLAKPDAAGSEVLISVGIFLAVLLFVTVGQRFAVPGAGSRLAMGFVLAYGAFLFGLLNGVLRISPVRILLYSAMAITLLALIFTLHKPFSELSLAMLLILYLPFVAVAPLRQQHYLQILMSFQGIMTFCALCGIFQFSAQLFVGSEGMFPFDRVLPEAFFQPNFNLAIPISEGSSLLKSTGLWFLEPSHFSQFLAFAIVIEILYFRRATRVALFCVAYLLSFSGTGCILIGVTLIFYAIRRGNFLPLLAAALSIAVIAVAFHDVPPLSVFFNRLAEFSNGQASGSMRFLAPFRFVDDVLVEHPGWLALGAGPGSIDNAWGILDYKMQDSSWLKLLTEYGIVGAVPFMAFYLYCLFWRSPDLVLSVGCLTQFLLLGGYLNSFYVQFLHMALVGWPRIRAGQ